MIIVGFHLFLVNMCLPLMEMKLAIPEHILANEDRNTRFQEIRAWMLGRESQPAPAGEDAIASGCAPMDAQMGGGFARGAVTECVERQAGCGGQHIIHRTLHSVRLSRKPIVLIDACHHFDPASAAPPDLESLLWIRCPKALDAFKAADILLRDDTFPIIMMDLRDSPDRMWVSVRNEQWIRLQRTTAQHHCALVVWTSSARVPCARTRLALTRPFSPDLWDHHPASAPVDQQLRIEVLKRQIFAGENGDIPSVAFAS